MKYTLLEIVQKIHSDLAFDAVNSIGDTDESVRVASIAEQVFFEMISQRDWPHTKKLGRALSTSDTTKRTQLLLPETLSRLDWITYNRRRATDTRDKYEGLTYKTPDDFLLLSNSLDSGNSNVEANTTYDGATYYIWTDRPPTFYTSFDDNTIVLDSVDLAVESTVQGIHSQISYHRSPVWDTSDDFVPDLPDEAFPGYMAEVRSVTAVLIKEVQDAKAEQQSTRQRRRLSNQAWRTHDGFSRPDYGRRPKGGNGGSRVAQRTFSQE